MTATEPTSPSHRTRGYILALISALILSTTGIFIRILTQDYHMAALVLALWREIIITLTLLPVLAIIRPALLRVSRRDLRYLAIYGVMLAIFNSLWTLSVSFNGAAVATVLAYSSAGFTALLGWLVLKERLDWSIGLAVVLTIAGCVLVAGAYDASVWRTNLIGIVTGLLSGLWYAIYSLMGRSASQRGLNAWTTLLYTFGFAAIVLGIVNLLPLNFLPGKAASPADFFILGDSLAGWAILFVLAAGPTLIGYGLYNASLHDLPSSVANLVVTLEPAFTAVIAYLLLDERLTLIQIAGSVLIVLGVAFMRLYEGWRDRRIATENPPTLVSPAE